MLDRTAVPSLVDVVEELQSERSRLQAELAIRQKEIVFLATHDPLTALPNRTLVLDSAEQLLARGHDGHPVCAALFVGLTGFKSVNDGLGHAAGDELLVAVAERLHTAIPGADTIGRLGGDEFVILVDSAALVDGPEPLAERVLEALSEPFTIAAAKESDGQRHSHGQGNSDGSGHSHGRVALGASVGIALGDHRYDCAAELLHDAGIAMRRAKLSGRNRFCVFETGMQHAAHGRIQLEMALRDAVGTDGFQLVYQPMLDLATMAPVRMEALLRWRRPDAPPTSADEFIPILEESGLIADVGRWALAEACRRCAGWREEGLEIGVAVNVSAVQLETDRFITDVTDALSNSGLEPGALTLEITETALMRDADRASDVLWAIKHLGVRLSIDDFGTGYSSLSYLQRFPVDELKLDRSFVSQLEGVTPSAGQDQRDAMIRTFITLCRSLEIETVAEGIEDRFQLEWLRAERCDIGQGFLFARPMDAGRCIRFLRRWRLAPV